VGGRNRRSVLQNVGQTHIENIGQIHISVQQNVGHTHFECQVAERRPEHDQEVPASEPEFFIDNLLVRIHLLIYMILVDRARAMGI